MMAPEAFDVLSEKCPIAIPVKVPFEFLTPANNLGVMTLLVPIVVLLLFQSLTQSSMLASTPAEPVAPLAPVRALAKEKDTVKGMEFTVIGISIMPFSANDVPD